MPRLRDIEKPKRIIRPKPSLVKRKEGQAYDPQTLGLTEWKGWHSHIYTYGVHVGRTVGSSGKYGRMFSCQRIETPWSLFEKKFSGSRTEAQAQQDPKKRLLSKLESIESLLPGWDGRDAEAVSPEIIRAARFFVLSRPSEVLVEAMVVPMTGGRLQFEWHSGPITLEIEFESDTTLHYLKWDSRNGTEEEDLVHVEDDTQISGLINWFFSARDEYLRS